MRAPTNESIRARSGDVSKLNTTEADRQTDGMEGGIAPEKQEWDGAAREKDDKGWRAVQRVGVPSETMT